MGHTVTGPQIEIWKGDTAKYLNRCCMGDSSSFGNKRMMRRPTRKRGIRIR